MESFRPTRAQGEIVRWRAEGLEEGVIALTYHRLWAGKPLPLIAWLETHEPESLKRAHRALMCKDYLRFRFAGAFAAEISDLSSGGLVDQRLRRWNPAVLDHLGLGRYAALFGETLEPLTIAGTVTREAAAETGLVAGTPVSAVTPTGRRWRLASARPTRASSASSPAPGA